MTDELKNVVEAVLLASDAPLNVARIRQLFESDAQPSADEIEKAIETLQQECEARGIELCKIGTGYRYQTRPKFADWISKLHTTRPPKLSRALLETLAIIAYRQPVTRGDIEEIRGVGVSTEIMQRLVERDWIKAVGVRDIPGHPMLFATTSEFLSWFGLESIKHLPPLSEQRELGTIAGEMDMTLPPEVLENLEAGQQDIFGDNDDSSTVAETIDEEMNDETEH